MRERASSLTSLPGVGPATARDLVTLGIRESGELRGRDPEALYSELKALQGETLDRCVLYVLRCAVYWATAEDPDPTLDRWWAFKEGGRGYAALLRLMEDR